MRGFSSFRPSLLRRLQNARHVETIGGGPIGLDRRNSLWQGIYQGIFRIPRGFERIWREFLQRFRGTAANSLPNQGREFIWPEQGIFHGRAGNYSPGQGIALLRPASSPRPPGHGIFFTGFGSSPNSRAALPPRILRLAPS